MPDRSVEVRLRADISNFVRQMGAASAAAKGFSKNLESADGRMANLVQTGLALAPALVPIGAVAVPAIAGLATSLGFAATAAGVSVLAFQGIGDGLKALNEYQLEPTQANLEKLNAAMATLGPAGQDFVRTLQSLRPEMQGLQDIAQEGLFPGMTDGINELMVLMPQAEDLIGTISTTLGDLAREAGGNLNDARWVEFLEFLDREAEPTLSALGRSFGNVIEGLANMMMAADPLSDMFTRGMLEASRDFVAWSENLADSDGFQAFVDYIRDNGPQAMQTLGAIGEALVSLVTAAAPVGAVTLPVLEALAKTLSALADSPAGPVLITTAAAVGILGRSLALLTAVGLRGGGGGVIPNVLGVPKMKDAAASMRQVTAATTEFRVAQEAAGAAALRMRDAQFALIPAADKRNAVRQYTTALDGQRAAAEKVAVAEKARSSAIRQSAMAAGRSVGLIAGLTLATTGVAESTGFANTATLGLMGTIAGPWGAAVGAGVGLLLDFKAASSDVTDEVRGLNEAMQAGDRDDMVSQMQAVRDEMRNSSGWTHAFADASDDLTGRTDNLNAALTTAEERLSMLDDAAGRTEGIDALMGGPLGLAREMDIATDSVEQFAASFAALNSQLDRSGSLIAYEAALDDLSASLKKNGQNWNVSTAAGRENLEKRNALVDKAIQRSQALKEAGDNLGAQHILSRAIDDLQKFGKGSPAAKAAVHSLIAELKRLDGTEAEPTLDADNKPARHKIDEATDWLFEWGRQTKSAKAEADTGGAFDALYRLNAFQLNDKSMTVTTYYATVGNRAPGSGVNAGADGMTVPGPRYPYGDKVMIWAAPGEEVISNRHGEADRYRAMRGYADGGAISTYSSSRGGGGRNGHGVKDADDAAKSFAKRLKDAQKELEKETEQRRNLVQDMKSFKSEVAGSFEHDLFGNGLAGFDMQAEADRNDAMAMQRALRKAKKKGLDGGLFAALAASGDLNTAQQFAGLTRRQIKQRESLFAQTRGARAGLGEFAANEKFGDTLKETNQTIRELKHEIKGLRQHIGKDVEKGARAGVGDQNRRTQQRAKVGH